VNGIGGPERLIDVVGDGVVSDDGEDEQANDQADSER